MTSYDDVNPGPDLGQAKESLGGGGGNGIPILPSWIGCLISSTICTVLTNKNSFQFNK